MIIAALVMALQAVSPAQVENVERTAPAIRASLERQMIDYPSARFRDVYVMRNPVAEAERGQPGAGYLCGYVNGKNRMGGYAGWQMFVAFEGDVMLAGDSVNDIVIEGACVKNGVSDGVDRSEWLRPR